MKLTFFLVSLLLVGAAADHPIQSVIKLLKELQDQVWDESQEETATYMTFKKWCGDNALDENSLLKKAVASDKEDIDTLTDTVESKTKERDLIQENIEFLEDEIVKYDAEETQAKKDRDAANKIYKEVDKDFETTIKAVDDAITALVDSKKSALLQFLKPENARQEQALRQLIQQPLVLEQLTDEQRESLSAAVFGGDVKPVTEADILAKEKYAKAGNTYTFKSGNVIDLLRSLKTHFKNEKTAATKAETAAENEYQVAKDSRKAAIKAAKDAKESKTKLLGEVKKDLNTAKSDLKDEKDELKADLKTLEDTTTTCQLKASQFKERSKLRHHEIEALKAAQEILALAAGVRHEVPDNEKAPEAPKAMLLQVRKLADPKLKMKAVNLLKQEATQVHSKQLERFAEQLATKLSGDGPFDQINNMIQKMIFRLMDEQKDEDEHKLWCDTEVSTSETSEKDKTAKVKSLDTKIKDSKARVDELEDKIEDLDKKVVKLTEFMKEASEVRAKSKKENQLAIKDAEKAQAAIAKAITVLTQFYKDSGMIEKESYEFVQVKAQDPEPVKLPEQPSSWGDSYTGVTDPTKKDTGVIAVLKATAADFSKMEADTRANEIADQEQFDQDMSASDIDKAKTAKESEMKTDEKKRTLDSISAMEKQRKHTNGELEAVKQYIKDLQKPCVSGDSKYEDRKKARSDEIEALKKAQGILEEAFDESLLQTVNKHA
jgi:hypothetical protein